MIDGFTVEQSKKWSNRGASTVLSEMYYQDKVRYFFGLNNKYVENVYYWDYVISKAYYLTNPKSDLVAFIFN